MSAFLDMNRLTKKKIVLVGECVKENYLKRYNSLINLPISISVGELTLFASLHRSGGFHGNSHATNNSSGSHHTLGKRGNPSRSSSPPRPYDLRCCSLSRRALQIRGIDSSWCKRSAKRAVLLLPSYNVASLPQKALAPRCF